MRCGIGEWGLSMPIRPENRPRYPAHWPALRLHILERAENACEHPGCNAKQYDYGYWRDGRWTRIGGPCETYAQARQCAAEEHFARFGDEVGDYKIIVIVLTIAHLDHTPEHCEDSNLRAFCQRHHLAHDHHHHQATAQATRRAKAGTLELF